MSRSPTHNDLSAKLQDPVLARLFEELTNKTLNGESIDAELLCEQHPDYVDAIREIVHTMHELADWGDGLAEDSSATFLDELPSRRLCDFRLLHEIGRGGMGVVYEAEQVSLGRRVAVKVLPFVALLDQRQLQRFKNEARAAAMLKHSNIVSVHSVGCERGVHFYAMELIDGHSLADVIRHLHGDKKPHSSDKPAGNSDTCPVAGLSTQHSSNRKEFYRSIVRLGIDAANALQYAHAEGIVHRDIKPSNILIDQDGKVFLADFGLARVPNSEELSSAGDLIGTLRYMSPEQLTGKTIVDHRTDVWSLGLTLYELIAGRPAFDATDHGELTNQILLDRPTDLSKLDPSVPKDLETILAKAIEHDANARYQTAEELAEDLQRFLDHQPVQARRVTRTERARRWVARNPLIASLLSVCLIALTTLAIGSTFVSLQFAKDAREKEIALYARDMRIVANLIEDGSFVDAERILSKWVSDDGETDHRGFEWSYLWNKSHDPAIVRTIKHKVSAYDVEFLDENRVAIGWLSDQIPIWDFRTMADGEPEKRLRAPLIMIWNVVADHKSGTLWAGDTEGNVIEYDVTSGEPLTTLTLDLPLDSNHIQSISIQPNEGRYVLIAAGSWSELENSGVFVWDRQEKQYAFQRTTTGRTYARFVDENTFVIGDSHDEITVVRVEDWSDLQNIPYSDGVREMVALPKAGLFAIGRVDDQANGFLELWSTDNWTVTHRILLGKEYPECIAVDSNDSTIAIGSKLGTLRLIDVASKRVLSERRIHAGSLNGLRFSLDDKLLATASIDGNVHFWDTSKLLSQIGEDFTSLANGDKLIMGAAFLDDDTACFCGRPARAAVFDIRSGQKKRELPLPDTDGNAYRAIVSPNRRFLAITEAHPTGPTLPGTDDPIPGQLVVFDTQNDFRRWQIEITAGMVYANAEFARDNRHLVLCTRGGLMVIDVIEQRIAREGIVAKDCGFFKTASFSPDGNWLIAPGTKGIVYRFDTATFTEHPESIDAHDTSCIDSEFSPDGSRLAIVGVDRQVKLFDGTTLAPLKEFELQPQYSVNVHYSPDGKRILTAGPDGIAKLWHAKTGEQLAQFEMSAIGIYPNVEFSPDGNSIIGVSGDTIRVWNATDFNKIKTLTISDLAELTCQDITLYGPARWEEKQRQAREQETTP
ncbi:MAG: protein kinase [Planctomycetales bacterium]|nr:protein kinase [Planctomycetales bacterium]